FGRFRKHGRGRAIFFVGKLDGSFDSCRRQIAVRYGKGEVDLGKHLGIGFGPFGVELDLAALDGVPAAFKDKDDVVGGAAARAGKHQFHRARGKVVAAAFGGAVHGGDASAAGARHEKHAFRAAPIYSAFHFGLVV